MVTPFACPNFIPQLWPAVRRSTSQYKPDTWNHKTFGFLQIYNIPFLQNWNVRIAFSEYIFFLPQAQMLWWGKKKLRVWWMCSGQRRVGGLYLSALLLQQTAELQANKLRYHHRHQQQIPLQQLSAVHITSLTAQKTCTYPESSVLECLALKICGCFTVWSERAGSPNDKNIDFLT